MPKIWKILLSLAGLALAVLAFLVFYQGSTEPIERVANQFKPNGEWALTTKRVTPPQFHCLGGTRCPSLHRSWKTGTILTKEEIWRVVRLSGWDFPIEGDCEPSPLASGSPGSVCFAKGVVDGFDVNVTVFGTYGEDDKAGVSLSVE